MRKKLKYQGGLTKLLCQKQANWNKSRFLQGAVVNGSYSPAPPKEVNFDIISFSGGSSFEDQMLSIYSFLFYAGQPKNWTIYSDKTYTPAQKELLRKRFPFVSVVDWDVYDLYEQHSVLGAYLAVCPLAKKLNIILGHSYRRPTIYLDSDIVFYRNIYGYIHSGLLQNGLWYVPDTMWGDIGPYFSTERESIYPLNSGLLILNAEFDKSDILQYLESLHGAYGYFTEQSSFEYAFRKQGANLLDPRQFIIDTSDQFDFAMKYDPDGIAMRHYTGPVRHKMWQKGWKWHFMPLAANGR